MYSIFEALEVVELTLPNANRTVESVVEVFEAVRSVEPETLLRLEVTRRLTTTVPVYELGELIRRVRSQCPVACDVFEVTGASGRRLDAANIVLETVLQAFDDDGDESSLEAAFAEDWFNTTLFVSDEPQYTVMAEFDGAVDAYTVRASLLEHAPLNLTVSIGDGSTAWDDGEDYRYNPMADSVCLTMCDASALMDAMESEVCTDPCNENPLNSHCAEGAVANGVSARCAQCHIDAHLLSEWDYVCDYEAGCGDARFPNATWLEECGCLDLNATD